MYGTIDDLSMLAPWLRQWIQSPGKSALPGLSALAPSGHLSLWSIAYSMNPVATCFRLLMHAALFAWSFARDNAGRRIEISTAMIPITTNNSTSVKAFLGWTRVSSGYRCTRSPGSVNAPRPKADSRRIAAAPQHRYRPAARLRHSLRSRTSGETRAVQLQCERAYGLGSG